MNPSAGSWYFLYQFFQGQYLLLHFLLFVCLLVIILLNVINMSWWERSHEPQVILVSASDQVSLLYSTANISSCCHNSHHHSCEFSSSPIPVQVDWPSEGETWKWDNSAPSNNQFWLLQASLEFSSPSTQSAMGHTLLQHNAAAIGK